MNTRMKANTKGEDLLLVPLLCWKSLGAQLSKESCRCHSLVPTCTSEPGMASGAGASNWLTCPAGPETHSIVLYTPFCLVISQHKKGTLSAKQDALNTVTLVEENCPSQGDICPWEAWIVFLA